jgi:CubicO group peptidase (beta-lactamase class C family)
MRRLLAAGLSCVVSTLPASAAGPAGTPALGEALARFDRAIRAEMDTGASPGLAAAIVLDGETLWTASYGSADVAADRPVDRSSRFILGSISKLFTALAIVQLRDAGKLGLDDAVTRHLPWFTLAGTPRPTLTLRELLLQLGGLPREPIGASWLDRVMPTKEDLVRTMADEAPALPPETAWKYSNLGYAVLGLVVEAASGESYADYVAGHITRPLGMVDTVAAPRAGTGDRLWGESRRTARTARFPGDGWRAAGRRHRLDRGRHGTLRRVPPGRAGRTGAVGAEPARDDAGPGGLPRLDGRAGAGLRTAPHRRRHPDRPCRPRRRFRRTLRHRSRPSSGRGHPDQCR